jgi:glycosyltransferase involved in cell wall biosynthesis
MKVSVIIPTHNSERTLERALQSVRNQTAECEIEILLCDDHSENLQFLFAMAEKYSAELYRVSGRGGPNYGRNRGMKVATGDVIAFLDHDDEWLPNKLETQLKEIYNGAELVYSPGITCKE